MPDPAFPVQWAAGQPIVSLPEHIDVSNAGLLRDQLLMLINRSRAGLLVDMSRTVSCDQAGIDAITRAYQRAVVSGSQLRLVVTAPSLRRLLGLEGLDRLVSIYPSLETAEAAAASSSSAWPGPAANGHHSAGQDAESAMPRLAPAVLWQLIDALGDGLVLIHDDGRIALVNRQCTEMFGYSADELVGQPVELLVPADLRQAHSAHRAAYQQAPVARPMAERARLVGVRKDGGTIPVEISLSPVPTATGYLILAVIRAGGQPGHRHDLVELARAAAAGHAAGQLERSRKLLDRVVSDLFEVGLSLQAAVALPADAARERITDALARLDDTVRELRDFAFDSDNSSSPAGRD